MGLDNFPKNVPCKTQGTAVLVTKRDAEGKAYVQEDGTEVQVISCEQTQACGGCPYKNDYEKSGLVGGAVYGMFGADCWYRGKYGNYLLEAVGADTDTHSFYGDQEDATVKSVESCLELADFLDDILAEEGRIIINGDDLTQDIKYAEWYLRWASEKCDGLGAWY